MRAAILLAAALPLAGCITTDDGKAAARAIGCAAAATTVAAWKAGEPAMRPAEAAVQAAVEEALRLGCGA